jgi:cytochrome c oxidase subunit 2
MGLTARAAVPRLLLVLLAAVPAGVVAAPFQDALRPAGVQAEHILALWRFTLFICSLVFTAVLATFIYALWRAPRSNRDTPADVSSLREPEPTVRRNVALAVGASTTLLFVLIVADVLTDRALAGMSEEKAVRIEMTSHQWWWEARYQDAEPSKGFVTANEFHVPVGRPIVVSLKSADVIHTFWLPNLHGKKDMIPGRTSIIRFRADKAGTYRGQCAEFCGFEHALMAFRVVAEPEDQYRAWTERQRQSAPAPVNARAARGQQVFLTTSCVMCHTIQGTTANATFGPDLTHLASRQTIASGAVANTQAHLAAWILDPQAVKPGANMPPNALPPDDLQALVSYLGTLE